MHSFKQAICNTFKKKSEFCQRVHLEFYTYLLSESNLVSNYRSRRGVSFLKLKEITT
jgi:hypothetical protein